MTRASVIEEVKAVPVQEILRAAARVSALSLTLSHSITTRARRFS
jgi:hypothetical protein